MVIANLMSTDRYSQKKDWVHNLKKHVAFLQKVTLALFESNYLYNLNRSFLALYDYGMVSIVEI